MSYAIVVRGCVGVGYSCFCCTLLLIWRIALVLSCPKSAVTLRDRWKTLFNLSASEPSEFWKRYYVLK